MKKILLLTSITGFALSVFEGNGFKRGFHWRPVQARVSTTEPRVPEASTARASGLGALKI